MATINTAWDHVSSNIFKTYIIMFFFSLFTFGVIYLLALSLGYGGDSMLGILGLGFIFIGVSNFISWFFSDKIVLSVSGAKPVSLESNRDLYRTVENLCIAAGLPLPKIYIIDDSAPNAFATGRDPKHGVVCFTTGILDKLTKQELEGVTAHELSHIGNRDTLVMSVVSVLVGTIALLADWYMRSLWFGGRDNDRGNSGVLMVFGIIAAILAPIIATIIQLAVSRKREYLADASGVLLTRHPDALAAALRKISGDKEPLEVANRGTAHLYIVNPLKGSQALDGFAKLFSTHPPIAERIKALNEMAGKI